MSITYIRHFKQISHKTIDSSINIKFAPTNFDIEYDYIICSPYLRCRQTAELINKITGSNKFIYIDVNLSEYQGHKKLKSLKLEKSTQEHGDIPPHNETWEECEKRLTNHISSDICSVASENILVITHGIIVKYMEEKYTGFTSYTRGRDVPFGKGFTIKVNSRLS